MRKARKVLLSKRALSIAFTHPRTQSYGSSIQYFSTNRTRRYQWENRKTFWNRKSKNGSTSATISMLLRRSKCSRLRGSSWFLWKSSKVVLSEIGWMRASLQTKINIWTPKESWIACYRLPWAWTIFIKEGICIRSSSQIMFLFSRTKFSKLGIWLLSIRSWARLLSTLASVARRNTGHPSKETFTTRYANIQNKETMQHRWNCCQAWTFSPICISLDLLLLSCYLAKDFGNAETKWTSLCWNRTKENAMQTNKHRHFCFKRCKICSKSSQKTE